MPTVKLSQKFATRLPAPDPSGRQTFYWDSELKGFGVLVSGRSSSKAYVVQHVLSDRRTRRVTIAPTNLVKFEDARERAKKILGEFYLGIDPKDPQSSGRTLRMALASYLEARADLKPRSAEVYRGAVERHLAPWLDRELSTITRAMIEERLREIAKSVARGNRYAGNATANGAMRAFRVLYNFVADRVEMPPNPVRLKKLWLPVVARTRCIATDDLPKFYEAVCGLTNHVARDYLLFVLFTGLRRREAAGLRWEHVDLTDRVIRLPAASTKAGRKLDLPMSDFVHDLLVGRRALGDATWVFPASSRSGHIEEPRHFFDLVHEVCGVYVSTHDLRRTFVTVAESCEISLLALKALVNHAIGSDVTSGYVIMNVERLREPAQRVADKLKTLCKIPSIEGDNVQKLAAARHDLRADTNNL